MKKTAICILETGGSTGIPDPGGSTGMPDPGSSPGAPDPGSGPDTMDLEVPLDLPAEDLIGALRKTFQPGLPAGKQEYGFLRCENPIALLHGRRTLREWGVRNGTILHLK